MPIRTAGGKIKQLKIAGGTVKSAWIYDPVRFSGLQGNFGCVYRKGNDLEGLYYSIRVFDSMNPDAPISWKIKIDETCGQVGVNILPPFDTGRESAVQFIKYDRGRQQDGSAPAMEFSHVFDEDGRKTGIIIKNLIPSDTTYNYYGGRGMYQQNQRIVCVIPENAQYDPDGFNTYYSEWFDDLIEGPAKQWKYQIEYEYIRP